MTPALRGHAAMLTFSVLVSGSFSLGNLIAEEIAPPVLNAVRFAISLTVLAVAARSLGIGLRVPIRRLWIYPVLGTSLAAYFITMFEALALTQPVSTAAVFTLSPVMAAIFGWFIVGQRSGALVIAALGIGALGAVWVIFRADLAALIRFDIGRGETIFLIGTVAYALYPALVRRFVADAPPMQTSVYATAAALLLITIYGWRDIANTDFAALRPTVWLVILYLAICASAVTFFLLTYASGVLPAAKVMAYTYLVPSWVVLWQVTLFGEALPAATLAGVAATLIALTILLMGRDGFGTTRSDIALHPRSGS